MRQRTIDLLGEFDTAARKLGYYEQECGPEGCDDLIAAFEKAKKALLEEIEIACDLAYNSGVTVGREVESRFRR